MVALIRDLGNKPFLFSFNMYSQQGSQLPTVCLMKYTGMDRLSLGPSPNNIDEVRGRTPTSKSSVSRDLSMFSTKSLVVYYERMEKTTIWMLTIFLLSWQTIWSRRKAFVLVRQLIPEIVWVSQVSNVVPTRIQTWLLCMVMM